MVCSTSLAIAIGLLGASIAVMFNTKACALKSDFAQSLNPQQLQTYESIIQHRMNLYIIGLILGLILGFIYLSTVSETAHAQMVIGTFGIIVLGVQYMYYTLAPKNEWMLDNITTPEQAKKWLDIYQYMCKLWHLGFVMGILGALTACYAYVK